MQVLRSTHGGIVFRHQNGTRLYWPETGAPLYLLGLRLPVAVTEPVIHPTEARTAAINAMAAGA